ncbi:group I truncated hemoglobin [Bailinhaonella thermotolerans]|uniref:group I truncated hemoglobin n=1 Tax=Bailinhaonella thermotolerans TaxID=1070861 RepID=UPI00192A2954|nr:group 1 truncated hemoglobin [Bailinhaonella thermotolerans]
MYERLGGSYTLARVIPHFYVRLLTDSALAGRLRGVDVGRLACRQLEFLGALMGGPPMGRDVDLAGAHRRLGITDGDFDRAVAHLAESLRAHGATAEEAEVVVECVGLFRDQIVSAPVDTA